MGRIRIKTGGNRHLCTVNCGQHAADHYGTQHGTELVGGLRNRRRSTRLIRRNAGKNQVIRDGLRRAHTQA